MSRQGRRVVSLLRSGNVEQAQAELALVKSESERETLQDAVEAVESFSWLRSQTFKHGHNGQ